MAFGIWIPFFLKYAATKKRDENQSKSLPVVNLNPYGYLNVNKNRTNSKITCCLLLIWIERMAKKGANNISPKYLVINQYELFTTGNKNLYKPVMGAYPKAQKSNDIPKL